jgi:hypothetical protein
MARPMMEIAPRSYLEQLDRFGINTAEIKTWIEQHRAQAEKLEFSDRDKPLDVVFDEYVQKQVANSENQMKQEVIDKIFKEFTSGYERHSMLMNQANMNRWAA